VGYIAGCLVCLVLDFLAWQGPFGVFESVAVAFEGEDFGVVDDPVDCGGFDGVVAEDGSPAGERQV